MRIFIFPFAQARPAYDNRPKSSLLARLKLIAHSSQKLASSSPNATYYFLLLPLIECYLSKFQFEIAF